MKTLLLSTVMTLAGLISPIYGQSSNVGQNSPSGATPSQSLTGATTTTSGSSTTSSGSSGRAVVPYQISIDRTLKGLSTPHGEVCDFALVGGSDVCE